MSLVLSANTTQPSPSVNRCVHCCRCVLCAMIESRKETKNRLSPRNGLSPSPTPVSDPASPVSVEDPSELIQSLGRLPAVEHTEFVPIDDVVPVMPLCGDSKPRLYVGSFNDLFNINEANDGTNSTSETKDAPPSTSETKDAPPSTNEANDGTKTSETKDAPPSTNETKDGANSTSEIDGSEETFCYGGIYFLGGEVSAGPPAIEVCCPCCDVKPATEVRQAVTSATKAFDRRLIQDVAGNSNSSSPYTIVHEASDDDVAYGEYRDLMSVLPNAACVVPTSTTARSVKQGIRLEGHVLPLYHHGTVSAAAAARLLATSQVAVPRSGDGLLFKQPSMVVHQTNHIAKPAPSTTQTSNPRLHLHRGTIRLPSGRYLANFRSEDRRYAAKVPFEVSHSNVSPIHVPYPYPSDMNAVDVGLCIQAKSGRQVESLPDDGAQELPKQKRREIVVSALRAQGQPKDVSIHSLFRKWSMNFARHPLPHIAPLRFTLRNAFPPNYANGGVVAGVKRHYRLHPVVVDTINDVPSDTCVAFDAETTPDVVRLLVWSRRLPKGGVKCRIKGLSEFYMAEHGWDEARECRWFQFRPLGMSNEAWIHSHPMTDMKSPDVYVENHVANYSNGCYAQILHFKLWDVKESVTDIYVGITQVATGRTFGEFRGSRRNVLVPAKTAAGTPILNDNGSLTYTRVSRWLLSAGRLVDPYEGYFGFAARSVDDDLHVELYSWDKDLQQGNAHIVTIIPYETVADPVPTLEKEYEFVGGDQALQLAGDVDAATVPVTAERIIATTRRRHSSRTLVRQTPGKGVFFDGASKIAVEDPSMGKAAPLYFQDVEGNV